MRTIDAQLLTLAFPDFSLLLAVPHRSTISATVSSINVRTFADMYAVRGAVQQTSVSMLL